jgi:hypothetical protein
VPRKNGDSAARTEEFRNGNQKKWYISSEPGAKSDELMEAGRWEIPDAYHDIIADMSGALHDTVSRPELAANVDSTGQNKSRHAVKRDGSL